MPQPHNIDANTTLITSKAALPIEASWFDPEFWQEKKSLVGTGQGRGEVWFIQSEFGDFVMRRYRRGGFIAKLNKSRFLFTGQNKTRPWQELELLEKMVELELPVPLPIAGLYRNFFGFYSAYLLTQTIDNARDLFDILKAGHADQVDWKKIGQVIQRFHSQGIYHSDLNCHNIMIDADEKVWVIDFDKCEQRKIDEQWTQSNIDRLKRSLDKETQKHEKINVTEQQWRDFLEGYRG